MELPPEIASALVTVISPRARRLTLRLDAAEGRIVLVRPKRCSDTTIRSFVTSRVDWITRQLESLPPRIVFADGAVIPYRGKDHVVRLESAGRGAVRCEGNEIIVTGRPEHTARRVKDWLKDEARKILTPMVQTMAAQVDRKVKHVTVRDTRSRWGSCSRDGKLSFSWRLILAPESVLTYVAAHEVAHLVHLDHSRAFWRSLAALLESYAAEIESPSARALLNRASAREWLRRRGAALHRYG